MVFHWSPCDKNFLQVPKDSSRYSGRSQQCCNLDSERTNYNCYHHSFSCSIKCFYSSGHVHVLFSLFIYNFYFSIIIIIIIITNWLIGILGRMFANGPEDLGSIPARVIPKTFKMVLDTSLLCTRQYKVRIKGKVEQSRERNSALPYTSV